MNAREKDLADVLVSIMDLISSLQKQSSEFGYLLGDRLPGLTNSQRRSLKANSRTNRELADKTKAKAEFLRKVTGEHLDSRTCGPDGASSAGATSGLKKNPAS